MPLLEVKGWQTALPYLDAFAKHVPLMAPHAKRLAPYMDPALPYLPLLAKHIDNLAPQMGSVVDVMDRLVPFIRLLPIADQTGILNSRLAVMAMPTMARLLPRPSSGPSLEAIAADKLLASKLPGADKLRLQVVKATQQQADGVVLYSVLLNGVKRRDMRYSQLRALHDQLLDETTTYAQMKLLPFPDKTPFGRALSDRGVERRRIALEIYLERAAMHAELLADESQAFRAFVRSFDSSQTK
jgi:hypothetical protein